MKSQLTTLCYIQKENSYLMLHRISKKNDINKDKWIGVGGHFEFQESPEDCLVREVKEETGLTLKAFDFRGIVTFLSDNDPAEYMCLYTSSDFEGELKDCDEGKLEWVPFDEIENLNLWEGDKLFLKLLQTRCPFFSMKLVYKKGKLTESSVSPFGINSYFI
jgi:8-oxo-dGTP diphosphatase